MYFLVYIKNHAIKTKNINDKDICIREQVQKKEKNKIKTKQHQQNFYLFGISRLDYVKSGFTKYLIYTSLDFLLYEVNTFSNSC